MTTFVSNRDGGKTNEEGHYRFQVKTWAGNILTGFAPTENSPTGMSILISAGDARVDYGEYGFTCWSDATLTATFATANPTNPRIDRVVGYIDLNQAPQEEIPNNPGLLKIAVIAGTPDPSPTRPNDAAVDAGVVDNPWFDIADVAVAAGDTTLSNADITDTREFIQLLYDPLSMSGDGWIQSQDLDPPSSIVYNGQRSYLATWSGVDLTGLLSPGIRLKATRTVAAQTQCTSLNGSTQYWSKSSPNKLTFTDDFAVMANVRPITSFSASPTITSCANGTQGWILYIETTGQISLAGYNASLSNFSKVTTNQSIALDRHINIAAQLDMSAFTATSTTSYIMLDGVDVPVTVSRGGTNPTALVQAGNLEVGSFNGGSSKFTGRIAQVGIFNAKVTQATMRSYMGQGLLGTETSLASGFSFGGNANDLNTTTPNNLTASGSATATDAYSPFGDSGASATDEFGIVSSVAFSTDTTANIQVPEGCALPTSGGISSLVYSHSKAPHKFPAEKGKWTIKALLRVDAGQNNPTLSAWYNLGSHRISAPIGSWEINYSTTYYSPSSGTQPEIQITLSTGSTSESDNELSSKSFIGNVGSAIIGTLSRNKDIVLTSPTIYYLNYMTSLGSGTWSINNRSSIDKPSIITLKNAYL